MSSHSAKHPDGPAGATTLFRPPSWSRVAIREKPMAERTPFGEEEMAVRLAESAKRSGVGPMVVRVIGIIRSKAQPGTAASADSMWLLNDLVANEDPARLSQALDVCISMMPHASDPVSFLRALVSAEQMYQSRSRAGPPRQ